LRISDCGLRISDCGFNYKFSIRNPKSEMENIVNRTQKQQAVDELGQQFR